MNTAINTLASLVTQRDWDKIAEMMERRAWEMLIDSDSDTTSARRAFDVVFRITSANDDWTCWLADGDWSDTPTLDDLVAEFVESVADAAPEPIDGMDALLSAIGG